MAANTVTATHPITGEVRKRTSKTMTYTHAVWFSIPAQTVNYPARKRAATRSTLAYTVPANTEEIEASDFILSFHTSAAAAEKARQAHANGWRGDGQFVKQQSGVIPVDAK